MNKAYYILITSVLVLFYSCREDANSVATSEPETDAIELQNTHTDLPLNSFIEWVANKENNLVKNKEISEMNYKLSFMPKEYLAHLELKNEVYTEEQFAESVKHYSEMTYFNFRIELVGGSGELLKYNLNSGQQYNDRINYMSFRMPKDIFLIQGKDSLSPDLFHFERIFEVAPYATVMIAFDDEKFNPAEEFTIVYNDRLFNKGCIKFNYRPKLLIDLPNISGV